MSRYIKYFDNGGKNTSFATDDKEVYEKYDEIWNVVKSLLKLKFAASPIRDDKYILAKLKIFNKTNIATFNNNNSIVPMEIYHYICIPAIDIDSVLKIDKKAYPQPYLEECKYKLKKRKPVSFMMMMIAMMMVMTLIMKIIFNILMCFYALTSSVKWGHLENLDLNSTNTILSTNPMGSSSTL